MYKKNTYITYIILTIFRHQSYNQRKEEPKIYNYVSSVESELTWNGYIQEMRGHYDEAPPLQSMWYLFYTFYTNVWIGKMLRFVLHRIPAAVIDLSLFVCGKKSK